MLLNNKFITNFYKYKRKLNSITKTLLQRRAASSESEHRRNEKNLKILFFGTDNFSLPSLQMLHKSSLSTHPQGIASLGAVTSFKCPANCVRSYGEQNQLPMYRWPITAEDCRRYDLGVVVSFGHLIPEHIIKAFPLGMINVHASLLPRWRGAAPIIYAIMNGDTTTGVSIMKIAPKHFDVGDVLAQKEVTIQKNILMPELHSQLAHEGAKLLIEVIDQYPQSFQNSHKQNNEAATYAPKVTMSLTEISWPELNAEQIYNRFRALFGYKNVHTSFRGKNVQIIEMRLPQANPSAVGTKSPLPEGLPGAFAYQKDRKCLLVVCNDQSYIEIYKLRVEGKKVMTALEFNNGFLKKLPKGERLLFTSSLGKSIKNEKSKAASSL